jgi:hypothetical protein
LAKFPKTAYGIVETSFGEELLIVDGSLDGLDISDGQEVAIYELKDVKSFKVSKELV